MSIEQYVTYNLRCATVHKWPFPHFYCENVFPQDFYDEIQAFLRSKQDYAPSPFLNRNFTKENEIPGLEFMKSKEFLKNILAIFDAQAQKLPNRDKLQVYRDIRLIRDQQNYKIGPHTDARWKLISLLFYLPEDSWNRDYGTSLYVPKDQNFVCEGGPHYPFEPFDHVYTAPFIPNSCLGFWKTNKSFHGVPPIPVQFRRDMLLYNVYQKEAFDASHKPADGEMT